MTSLKHQNFQVTEVTLSAGLKLLEETEAEDIYPFPAQPFLTLSSSTTWSLFAKIRFTGYKCLASDQLAKFTEGPGNHHPE